MKITDLTTEQILKIARKMDGHTIFDRNVLVKAGWPEELIEEVCDIYESGNHPKEMIFDNNGNRVNQLAGFYWLHLLSRMIRELGITDAEGKLGRGSQARAYVEAIERHFKREKV